jgi:hypothetical protein
VEGGVKKRDLTTRLRDVVDFATGMRGRMYCLSERSIDTLKEALAELEKDRAPAAPGGESGPQGL